MEILMYEGYLRNRQKLCAELSICSEGSRDEVERRILLEGWRRWGRNMLPRLYGSFAFVLRNAACQELFCARDSFGLSGFYYHVTAEGELLCSSDLSDIVNAPGFVKEIDPEALQRYMEFGYPAGERTLYRGVKKLLPGHSLIFRDGGCRVERWFKPVFLPEKDVSEGEWARELDQTLSEILSEDRECFDVSRCRAFLSGGVDSSYLLAASGVKNAVNIGFGPGEFSETGDAAATARLLGAELREIHIAPTDYFSAIPWFVRNTELPLADTAAVAFAIGCNEISCESGSCLSGEGADEFFAGYHVHGRASELSKRGGAWYYGCDGVMEPEAAARLLRHEHLFPRESLVEGIGGDDALAHMLGVDIALWLEGDILLGVRRAARSCRLDLLLPYADPRIFALSARIPSHLKRKGECGKYILRKAAALHLPLDIAFRPKAGFPVPVRDWLRAQPWKAAAEELLFGKTSFTFFDDALLRRYWDAYCAGGQKEFRVVYAAYIFLLWYNTIFRQGDSTAGDMAGICEKK